MSGKRWRCSECEWVGPERDLLVKPNPFEPQYEVCGCPDCRAIDHFELVCDAGECMEIASCGWPSPGGYRNTCHKHMANA